jgi:hypothetical protein
MALKAYLSGLVEAPRTKVFLFFINVEVVFLEVIYGIALFVICFQQK